MPRAAIITNQSTIAGPNIAPTRAVPRFWSRNRATRMPSEIGTTNGLRSGVATSSPSIAPRTVITGVIMPSANRSAVPNRPRRMSQRRRRRRPSPFGAGEMRAIRAMIPPSPWLSARITKTRYLRTTTRASDQKISDSTPRTLATVGSAPCPGAKHSRMVYSGEVPMSP